MAKAKDLSAEDIGKIVEVETTTISVEGVNVGMEGQVSGKLEAIFRSPKDYLVLTIAGEQYAVLRDAPVFSEHTIREAL